MKILIAIDSFKESLTSAKAGAAVAEAAKEAFDEVETKVIPIADGGEGTVQALSEREDAKLVGLEVTGPLRQKVRAEYCILNGKTAVMEMASAAGLALIRKEERAPLETTTVGVGEIIKDAINKGCRDFIVGLGGSATNDGGIGMLSSLGYGFFDKNGDPVPLCAKGLETLFSVSSENVIPELKDCNFRVACDVKNPLFGENGCSRVFGKQKGASPEDIEKMDEWMQNYADAVKRTVGGNADHPGAGAAGGLGFAFLSFLGAKLESGIDIVLSETGLEEEAVNADIVVTGEGRLDSQTAMGKAPSGVAGIAKKYGKTVIAFSGCVTKDARLCNECGIDAYFPILRGIVSREEAIDPQNAYCNLKNTAYQVFRLIKECIK